MDTDDSVDVGASDSGVCEATERFQTQHDWDDGPITASVVNAIAAVTGDEPTAITPLYEVVDPDALDHLFESVRGDELVIVSFHLAGCAVRVGGDGDIEVRPDPGTRF